ncbi:MAG TPA: hypothetical protein VNJ28_02820, partial [Candidatus Limnocylindrales bacterium]|nr:hypothetical protein [Candidatus Limnocylindrales bacterium]
MASLIAGRISVLRRLRRRRIAGLPVHRPPAIERPRRSPDARRPVAGAAPDHRRRAIIARDVRVAPSHARPRRRRP